MSDIKDQGSKGPTYRVVMLAVIILTALFLAGMVALIFGFMRQYRIYQAGRRGAGAQTVNLPPGARVVSSETKDGRLILHVQTPKGSEVDVIDLASGKLITRVQSGP